MSKNKLVWLALEVFCYFLLFYLIPNFVYSINERSQKNSATSTKGITLISKTDPIIIHQINREAKQERIERFEEQQQLLNERRQQRNEQRQQEWNEQRQQWRNQQREQQEKVRDIRRQQQEKNQDIRRQQQERIHQREELIRLN